MSWVSKSAIQISMRWSEMNETNRCLLSIASILLPKCAETIYLFIVLLKIPSHKDEYKNYIIFHQTITSRNSIVNNDSKKSRVFLSFQGLESIPDE